MDLPNLGVKMIFGIFLATNTPIANAYSLEHIQTQLQNVQEVVTMGIQETFQLSSKGNENNVFELKKAQDENLYEILHPQIRVGLYWVQYSHVDITASRDYRVENEEGDILAIVRANTPARAKYDMRKKVYTVTFDDQVITSEQYIRFVPIYKDAPFELINYSRPNPWYRGQNDNVYRGVIEFRYIPRSNVTYIINELYIEDYVRGIGEANDKYDEEFYRVLAIITRTYALHYTLIEAKYPGLHFHVRATTHDQLYRGYNYEKNVPVFQKAVEDTKELIVTYQGKLAVTPYFAQSTGKTYSYKAVWGIHKPWIVGTSDKYYGNSLAGHGVGMPLMGAVYLVKYDKLSYEDVIRHYYKGVEIQPLTIA